MGLLRLVTPELIDPSVALERARSLLAADLWRLALPPPRVTINELGLAPSAEEPYALDMSPIDRVLCAKIETAGVPVALHLPMSGGVVLPAEIVGRLEVAAPASALLTPSGWRAHVDQQDDPVAAAFIDALDARGGIDELLAWGPPDEDGEDWAIQIVADAADACLIVVRTAPLGALQDRAGVEAFLDIMPVLAGIMRTWTQQVALPLGITRECVSLQELPTGVIWEPDWTHDEHRVFTPDDMPEDLDEESDDEVSTVLATPPPLINLAETDPTESQPPVEDASEALLLTYDGPVVEVFDDDGFEEDELEEAEEEEAEEEEAEEEEAEEPALEQPEPAAELPAPTGPRPGLAAAASFLLPGVGQIMCGQVAKGGLIMAVAVVTLGLGGVLNLAMAIDAWLVATTLREGGQVRRWRFFG